MCSCNRRDEPLEHSEPCGYKMRGFLKAALLLISRSSGYGYTLQQALSNYGLIDQPDIGAIYRGLRALESAGHITSEWQGSESGPEKRVYSITETGRERLRQWGTILRERRHQINVFLDLLDGKNE